MLTAILNVKKVSNGYIIQQGETTLVVQGDRTTLQEFLVENINKMITSDQFYVKIEIKNISELIK